MMRMIDVEPTTWAALHREDRCELTEGDAVNDQSTEPQVSIIYSSASASDIEVRVRYPDSIMAAQQHRGWLIAWKSGRLERLIADCTWESFNDVR